MVRIPAIILPRARVLPRKCHCVMRLSLINGFPIEQGKCVASDKLVDAYGLRSNCSITTLMGTLLCGYQLCVHFVSLYSAVSLSQGQDQVNLAPSEEKPSTHSAELV